MSFYSFSPKKSIFLFSSEDISDFDIGCVKKFTGKRNAAFVDVASLSAEEIAEKIASLAEKSGSREVFVDLTSARADTIVALKSKTAEISSLFFYDVKSEGFVTVGSTVLPKAVPGKFSVGDVIMLHGASAMFSGRQIPDKSHFPILKKLSGIILGDLNTWRKQGKFIQRAQAKYSQGLCVSCETQLSLTNETLKLDENFLYRLYDAGALDYASVKNDVASFKFHDSFIKNCLCDIGIWTEMITYISAVESGFFGDCRMSVKIDWDGSREDELRGNAYNEIDGIFMRGHVPVFVSCKTSEPSTEAINELYVYGKKFGGPEARLAVVTLCDIETSQLVNTSLVKRCFELGITLIDITDILEGKTAEKLAGIE